jgi:hypothetical protein
MLDDLWMVPSAGWNNMNWVVRVWNFSGENPLSAETI